MDVTYIGRKIQELRKDKGLTQEDLARIAKISHATLLKIEQGQVKNPTVKSLIKIAQALEISMDLLVKK